MATALTKIKSLLFDHKSVKQTIFKNTFWLTISEGVSRVATLILFVYIARILGATEYGKFSYAIAIVGLFSILPGFISPEIITRELSQDKEKEKEYSDIFSLKILLGFGSIILLFICSFFVSNDPVIRKAIWILAIYNFLNGFYEFFFAFLRARQRMEYESIAKILDAILTAGFGFFVIFKFPSVENLSYAYLFETILVFAVILVFFHFKFQRLSFGWNKKVWGKIFSLSWPMALVGIVVTVYNQIDSVMMGFFGQLTENGWYNAALKIVRIALLPVALLSQSFYPVLSKFFKESKEKLQEIWEYQTVIMILIAIPLTVGGIVLAPKIINFFYGQAYDPAILAFQILIVMSGIIFLYDTFRQILIISNHQKTLFAVVVAGAVANIILNWILIPKFTLYGAATATVLTNILILFLLTVISLKLSIINPFTIKILLGFISSLIASGIMYLAISSPLTSNINVITLILIGIAVYSLSLFALKFIFKLRKYEK